jgi:hypothetical protein
MTTQYTPTLKLALPVTGELSGTWGDVVNDNITSMIEQAIAGLVTINTWTGNAHTLTTANGTTSESRCAMLVAATGGGAPTAAAEIICPAAAKLYVLQNNTSFAVTLKTSAGTGVSVAVGNTAFLFCDGTNVNSCVTTIVDGNITGNLTVGGNATINGNTTLGNATSDTITATARFNTDLVPSTDNARDLGSVANSWKDLYIDGTAYLALVDINGGTIDGVSIGATTAATLINVDNLRLDGNTISSTDTNGNIVIAPNGTGDVQLDADTVRVGDSAAAATLTSNGAGALTVTTGGAADLTLSTNGGTTSGTVVIANGANGNITLTPDGTGDVILSADRVQIGDSNTDTTLTTNGTGSLNLTTNNGTNSGTIQLAQGVNGNITLTPNGTGSVSVPKLVVSTATATRVPYISTGGLVVDSANLTFNGTDLTVSGAVNAGSINATTLDLTNLEVTNIKAKDGTAAMTIADSTGAVTVSSAFSTQGNTTLGNAAADNVTVTGTVTSNLLFTDNTYDIGASGATRPRNLYVASDSVLGSSSGNTLRVNGYMGVGIAPDNRFALYVTNSTLSGPNVENIISLPTANSANTVLVSGYRAQVSTAAGSYTIDDVIGYRVLDGTKGAGSTITENYGFLVDNLTNGTSNVGFRGGLTAGANKWNLYMGGTARNFIAGNLAIGADTNTNADVEITSTNNPLALVSSGSGRGNIRLECTNVTTPGVSYIGPNAFLNNVFGMGTLAGTNWPVVAYQNGGQLWYSSSSGFSILNNAAPTMALDVNGADGAPDTTGTANNDGALRLRGSGSAYVMDMGISSTSAWIQPRNASNYATNANLLLLPNGGNLVVGANAVDAGGRVNIRGTTPLYLDKSNTAEATIRFRTYVNSYATEWGLGLRATDTNNFSLTYFDGTSWGSPVFNATASGTFGFATTANDSTITAYNSANPANWGNTYGGVFAGTMNAPVVSFTNGSNIRGVASSIYTAQPGAGSEDIALPWGGNYEMQNFVSGIRSTQTGFYSVYAISGYAISDGGAYGARLGADASSNASGGAAVGLYINNIAGGGSGGAAYGLFIGSTMSGTTQKVIYSDNANPSFLSGQLRLGADTNTTYWTGPIVPKLQVKGVVNAGPGSSGLGSSTDTSGGSIFRQTPWVGPASSFTINYSEFGAIDNSAGMVVFTVSNKIGGAFGGSGTLLAMWAKHSGGTMAVTTVSTLVAGATTTLSVAGSGNDIVVTTNSGHYLAWSSVSAG